MSRRIYQVGNAEITRISDVVLTRIKPQTLIPQWSTEQPTLSLSIHAWLVREEGHSILIGTAAGTLKPWPNSTHVDPLTTPFLTGLRESGVAPEDIDLVLLSHLHADNIGWNTRLETGRWIPTFPKARYLFPDSEYGFFQDEANCTEDNRPHFLAQTDSMQPVLDAGLGKTLEASLPVDGFTAFPAPGHTPAHTAFVLRSGDRIALFSGASLHHPIQVQNPNWNCAHEALPQAAVESRKRLLAFAADNEASVFTSHFTDSSVGRIHRTAANFLWRFM
jgi:glyoxylase-like metal-dependent hydrolase (beta-lactamase superfamily II)